MLKVEAAALALLTRRGTELQRYTKSPKRLGQLLYQGWEDAYFRARRKARLVARTNLGAELAIINGGNAVQTHAVARTAVLDRVAAQRAAHGSTGKWLGEVVDGQSHRLALKATRARLELAARTETATAFNSERLGVAKSLPLKFELWKVWDSQGDRRVCPTCDRLHGSTVKIDEDFPEADPGSVHGGCRCGFSIRTTDELAI